MGDFIKYLVILLVLLWSVTWKSLSEENSAIYIVKNGKLVPFKNTSNFSDNYYGRSTNSNIGFTKIIKDKNGKEINE
jgi:hypothetical protein